jgi:hypothetical protein
MSSTRTLREAANGLQSSATAYQSDLVDDLTALRSAVIAMAAKLDADGGVTDEDYESTLTPAALRMIK